MWSVRSDRGVLYAVHAPFCGDVSVQELVVLPTQGDPITLAAAPEPDGAPWSSGMTSWVFAS